MPALPMSSRSCSGLFTGVRLTATITSPGAHAGRAAAPATSSTTTPSATLAGFASPPARAAARRRRACPCRLLPSPRRRVALSAISPIVAFSVLRLAVAPDLERDRRARRELGDQRRQVGRARDRLAVELEDHVARLDAGLRRRAVLLHGAHQRAAGLSCRPKFSASDWFTSWIDTPRRPCSPCRGARSGP